ncbi:hypothetical protein [Novosphingobium sp.]|uniref:hypothetical protein n=1 Tax=Novosphingobium sp. TaxID=1874826 RepID=UPI0038B7D6A8
MAEYASKQALDDIEALLTLTNRSGEWNDDHEPILERWRTARGEAGLTPWRWWAKMADDDAYANELATRDEAIAWARREYPGKDIVVVEARCFADEVEGDEVCMFAEMRHLERLLPEGRS